MQNAFLKEPGRAGVFGALMDEYARAAEDFCRVIEAMPPERFLADPAADPRGFSPRVMCAHAIAAGHRYSDYIRKARGMEFVERYELDPEQLQSPSEVRPRLREVFAYTEDSLAGLQGLPEEEVARITFQVRWGPTYDPEMILEHAIVHLLRHRRQVERWLAGL